MSEQQSDQEKTEEPTLQKREDFRRQGQVAQTKELSSALVLFGVCLVIWFSGRFFIDQIFEIYSTLYGSHLVSTAKSGNIMPSLKYAFEKILLLSLPVFGIVFVMGMASTLLQIGVLFTGEPLTPNLNKLNPLQGLKRIFSLRSLVEGMKTVFKVSLVSMTIYMIMRSEFAVIPNLIFMAPMQVLVFISQMLFQMLLVIGGLMLVLAGFDYMFQRFDLEKQMRMTKQEVKEENKQREGDPMIKARIRKIQKEMANRRMMADVPKADVIITNPTHIAIAIKYDPSKYSSPIVLAKGVDHMAAKIRELAKEKGIPIVENKPLARTIYKSLEIGELIPRELFAAVAEVLAYVFKLKRKRVSHG